VIVLAIAFGVGADSQRASALALCRRGSTISSHAYRFQVGGCRTGEQPKRTVPQSPYRISEQPSDSVISPARGLRVRAWVCGEPPTKTPRESPYRKLSQPFESPSGNPQAKCADPPVRKSVEPRSRMSYETAAFRGSISRAECTTFALSIHCRAESILGSIDYESYQGLIISWS